MFYLFVSYYLFLTDLDVKIFEDLFLILIDTKFLHEFGLNFYDSINLLFC
jgi:hypothetical protein